LGLGGEGLGRVEGFGKKMGGLIELLMVLGAFFYGMVE